MEELSNDTEGLQVAQKLASCTLLEGIGESALLRLTHAGELLRAKRNEHVFREGDDGDRVYFILEGKVRISRQVPGMGEEALAVLPAGAAFGEMALVDGSPRSADALAHETCELFVIGKDELANQMFVDRTLACDLLWKIVRMLTRRLRQTNDKMTFLSITGRFE